VGRNLAESSHAALTGNQHGSREKSAVERAVRKIAITPAIWRAICSWLLPRPEWSPAHARWSAMRISMKKC